MTNKANISYFYSNCMLSVNISCIILYFLGDYAVRAMHFVKDYNETWRELPIKVQLPFKVDESPIFESFFILLFLFVMTNALTLAILDGTILSLVSTEFFHSNCNINQFLTCQIA